MAAFVCSLLGPVTCKRAWNLVAVLIFSNDMLVGEGVKGTLSPRKIANCAPRPNYNILGTAATTYFSASRAKMQLHLEYALAKLQRLTMRPKNSILLQQFQAPEWISLAPQEVQSLVVADDRLKCCTSKYRRSCQSLTIDVRCDRYVSTFEVMNNLMYVRSPFVHKPRTT